jgi:hypothetical protein
MFMFVKARVEWYISSVSVILGEQLATG